MSILNEHYCLLLVGGVENTTLSTALARSSASSHRWEEESQRKVEFTTSDGLTFPYLGAAEAHAAQKSEEARAEHQRLRELILQRDQDRWMRDQMPSYPGSRLMRMGGMDELIEELADAHGVEMSASNMKFNSLLHRQRRRPSPRQLAHDRETEELRRQMLSASAPPPRPISDDLGSDTAKEYAKMLRQEQQFDAERRSAQLPPRSQSQSRSHNFDLGELTSSMTDGSATDAPTLGFDDDGLDVFAALPR